MSSFINPTNTFIPPPPPKGEGKGKGGFKISHQANPPPPPPPSRLYANFLNFVKVCED